MMSKASLKKNKPMSGDEFRDAIAALGLPQSEYGRLIGSSTRSISHWAQHTPPGPVEALTKLLEARPELVDVLRQVMGRPYIEGRPVGRPAKGDTE
jgi:DNA-binding transcriptional regulator YiaG